MQTLTEGLLNKTNEMINSILQQEVEEIDFLFQPPVDNELTDSNTIHNGKVSIMFVDMRGSTEFTDSTEKSITIKAYRSYLKLVTYAIRTNGGFVRDFTGDGVLAVFCKDKDDNLSAEQKTINAAKLINTLIDYSLNPLLSEKFNEICISCGIGISSGNVSITKVGMRGREADDTTENETGTIWIGSCTNHASKLCGLAKPNEIIVDEITVDNIQDKNYIFESRSNGKNSYPCYVFKNEYIDIDTSIKNSPIIAQIATKKNDVISVCSEKLDIIEKQLILLGKQKKELEIKELQLSKKEKELATKENTLNRYSETLSTNHLLANKSLYNKYVDILSKSFLKKDYIVKMGEDFWDDIFEKVYIYGEKASISKSEIDFRICHYLSDIYKSLENWEKAYEGLCKTAEFSSWISLDDIEKIVTNSGHWVLLKSKLEERIKQPLEHKVFLEIEKALDKLKNMGY